MLELYPMPAGSINSIFNRPKAQPAKKAYDPLGLPEIKSQCVHLEFEELSEGFDRVRCLDNAVKGRSGFLCATHQETLFYQPVRRVWRDYDQEVVESIIKTETKALAGVQREVVRLTPNTYITFLKG